MPPPLAAQPLAVELRADQSVRDGAESAASQSEQRPEDPGQSLLSSKYWFLVLFMSIQIELGQWENRISLQESKQFSQISLMNKTVFPWFYNITWPMAIHIPVWPVQRAVSPSTVSLFTRYLLGNAVSGTASCAHWGRISLLCLRAPPSSACCRHGNQHHLSVTCSRATTPHANRKWWVNEARFQFTMKLSDDLKGCF